MKALQSLSIVLTVLVLAGCMSEPKKEKTQQIPLLGSAAPVRQQILEGRMQLQNKEERKTITLTVLAVTQEPSNLRLELNGPFGKTIGKMTMRGEQLMLLAVQQKKAFVGTASERSFLPVLPMTLHPRDLMTFLFGEMPRSWSCLMHAPDKQVCVQEQMQLKLTRDPRPEVKKAKWYIESPKYNLAFLPTSSQTNVELKPDTFSMPIPEGYSIHKVP